VEEKPEIAKDEEKEEEEEEDKEVKPNNQDSTEQTDFSTLKVSDAFLNLDLKQPSYHRNNNTLDVKE